ncbi:glycosyltransferase, partial [Arthrobacter sp.]|uniref:glycosyltransferase family A protein n=1 Tax=Arthrobacter sp. TaxID=1667 RepID=UPI00339B9007
PVGAYNVALEHVTGSYLVRLDADDELTPGALARATALLEAHPEVGFVYGRPCNFQGDELPPAQLHPSTWSIWNGIDWLELRCRLGVNCMTSPEVVIRASLQRELGGQLEELGHTHDMEMWLRAARHAGVGRVNNVDQAFIRIHQESRMRTLFRSQFLDLEERHKAFELALSRSAGRRVPGLDKTARISIAREAIDHVRHAYERRQTGDESLADFVTLAGEVWPPILCSRAMSGLKARQKVGPTLAPWLPQYFASAAIRGLRNRAAYRYWRWSGL